MQKCEKCGKDFYSDGDFEQHEFIEEQRAYLNATQAGAFSLVRAVSGVHSAMEIRTVYEIASSKGISVDEAINAYLALVDIWTEKVESWKKQHERPPQG